MKIFGVFTIRWAARDGTRYERRYLSLNTYTVPAAYEPNSNIAAWSERPTAINATSRYRFMTERSSQNGGESWSTWSAPVIDGYLAEDGRAFTIKGSAAGVIPYGGNLPNAPVEGALYLDNRASTSDIEKYENSTWTGVAADLNDAYLVDGHIYMKVRSQSTSASLLRWEDEGDIKGPKGDDGDDAYSVSVQPGILMFTQSLSDGSLDAPKSANVVVKKGNSNDAVSHTVSVTGASNCTYSLDNDTISVTPNSGKDNGYVTMSVAIANGPTFTLTLPFYCNLLKSWQEKVEGGVETIVARDISKVVNDGDGSKTINESKSVFNSIRDAVTSLLQWRTSKQSQYDGYSQRIDNTNTQLNSAEVSLSRLTKKVNDGKNLLSLTMGWEGYEGAAVQYDGKNFGVRNADGNLYSPVFVGVEGENYCFSVYLAAGYYQGGNPGFCYDSVPPTHISDLDVDGTYASRTFIEVSGDTITIGNTTYQRYYFLIPGSVVKERYFTIYNDGNYWFYCPQLEVGNYPTEFSANSQETSSQVKQTADSIHAAVVTELGETGIDINGNNRMIKAVADHFEIWNSAKTIRKFYIDNDGNIVGSGGASFNGVVKASAMYQKYQEVDVDDVIDPSLGSAIIIPFSYIGDKIYLPSASDYEFLTLTFYKYFDAATLRTIARISASGNDLIYTNTQLYGNWGYHTYCKSFYPPNNHIIRLHAIDGKWCLDCDESKVLAFYDGDGNTLSELT